MKEPWLRVALDLGAFFIALCLANTLVDNWLVAVSLALIFAGGTDHAQRTVR